MTATSRPGPTTTTSSPAGRYGEPAAGSGPSQLPHGVAEGAPEFARELRPLIAGEIRIDPGTRALYATDASNYRQLPIAVVRPRSATDVEQTVRVCRRQNLPLLCRGGGTALAGQTCNTAVILDFSRHMNRILDLDVQAGTATVEPGVVLDDLRDAAKAVGLTFGPDPATHNRCTLGGMIGNNSCGVHSVMAGRTCENVEALEILTPDGLRMWVGATPEAKLAEIAAGGGRRAQIYAALQDLIGEQATAVRERFPRIPRRVSGFNLDELLPEAGFNVARALVGTEGTCVVVLAAKLRLVPVRTERRTVVIGFDDGPAAADAVPAVMAHSPIGLEGFDQVLMDDVKKLGLHKDGWALLPDGGGWLLAEFGSDDAKETEDAAAQLVAEFRNARLLSPEDAPKVWGIRESGLGATARVPGEAPSWSGWEDSAVDPAVLGSYLRDMKGLYQRYGYHAALYGHFGQGCVHSRVDFDLGTAGGIAAFRRFLQEAAGLCIRHGGSLSGEHGDGQSRAELLPLMFGEDLVRAFARFKEIWDPEGMMNPGKVVHPNPITADLRVGADYRPRQLPTTFAFANDDGDFAKAVSRCVGVGACRTERGSVMCPSYQVTREEEHSTRGRAHLLYELLNGDELADNWRDPHVKDALDLCLSCKGCKHDCPVGVDMAEYKAEFLSHWWGWDRLRPAPAYAMGLIMYSSQLASAAPWLVNTLAKTPGISDLAKKLAGIHPDRQVPRFAARTFRGWWRQRLAAGGPGNRTDRVMLWPDTFTNHFRPGAGTAAVRVLEAAGAAVELPSAWVCCGRPLYDWGMLGHARHLLRRTLAVIGEAVDDGVPLVVLEPSCASVFRDELPELLPRDARAARLSALTFTLAEYLEQYRPGWSPPQLDASVLGHGHCHDRSVLDYEAEERLLRRTGARLSVPAKGCCGMAGAFGFEAGHYDVSQAIGEQELLPAVRRASAGTDIVADGFSCHEQIRQNTGRSPLHLAELLARGLDGAGRS
ncbi:MAG TPA: FAD-binding and (Fe-S)-binding domain-containing protein [Micrococcaceae bacterium]|jgi:FAD/FMN-containing dehydrogenase/Fe-S oxidoreductase|nr:FAD-binding and (Fe-S)-binding domain-containing protein [Micrococcaceae bacterium]